MATRGQGSWLHAWVSDPAWCQSHGQAEAHGEGGGFMIGSMGYMKVARLKLMVRFTGRGRGRGRGSYRGRGR